MSLTSQEERKARIRRHKRVRNKISGTAERPRLCVFRSTNHIYAQVINDVEGNTLVAASTLTPDVKKDLDGKTKVVRAGLVGAAVAKLAIDKGVSQVVFDRGGYKYHGRVKALAEAAREAGLKF
ncbi:MAG: 50S ribosomal protein L18 [Chloroflexi bacterium]|jgi:large subunit ribosomal protein L18|nr:50S ribosomal protein L18 [Chloroflexota bacterium]MBT7081944.1 50S ribosomal protein L18 [Chloroflexota bacterium]MBT7290514.1 50S ribosomal protein L18 [Chloroflexota bacterium]